MSPTITRLDGPRLLADIAVFGPAAAASEVTNDAAAQRLALVDAAGKPLEFQFDDNTIVIGAATWCSACAQFKTQLAAAQSAGQLAGLRVVFAFGDEGGAGPGGTLRPEFLSGLPGEVAFLAPGSVRPAQFPSAYSPQTGQFDRHAAEAVGDWLEGRSAVTNGAETPTSPSATTGSAPSCGCGSKTGSKNAGPDTTSPADAPSLAAALALQPGGPAPQSFSAPPGGTLELVDNGVTFDLVWTGTAGVDEVRFQQLDATTIRVSLDRVNGVASNYVEDVSGVSGAVKGYALSGNDKIDASLLTSTAALLDGGTGDNRLYGGQANDTLIGGSNGGEGQQGSNRILGGDGNDTIYGNAQAGAEGSKGGNHLLVGGDGNDTIYGTYQTVFKKDGVTLSNGGEGGQNLIVGGTGEDTIYASQAADGAEGGKGSILVADATALAEAGGGSTFEDKLVAILSEWTSGRSYGERIANLTQTGVGPRNNGSVYLYSSYDDVADQLFGDTKGSLNWFHATAGQDSAARVKVGEIVTDTSDAQAPGPFGIIGPPDPVLAWPPSPEFEDDLLIEWQASPGATSYQLVISHNSDLSSPFYSELLTGTSSPVFSITALGEGDYYIGLEAINAAGSTPAVNTPYYFEIAFIDLRQTLFVTDTEYYVDFFEAYPPPPDFFYGAAAANYHCTRMASDAGLLSEPWDELTTHYKALLTKTLLGLEELSVGNNGFVNTLGQHIASDAAELFSGDFSAPILTQYGDALSGYVPVWTGANPDGTWSGFTAEDWQDALSSATVGSLNGTGSQWISYTVQAAHLGARLYCIDVN